MYILQITIYFIKVVMTRIIFIEEINLQKINDNKKRKYINKQYSIQTALVL